MIRVAAAVCIQNGKVLLASRPAVRELKEELNWNILPLDIIYQLKKNNIMLYFVRVIPADDSLPRPCENQEIKWVELAETFPENMLESDREFWKFLTLC